MADSPAPVQIDRESGIIKDVVCIQAGEAKGHGVHCDTDFLKQLTSQGNLSEIGIKSRFGHPNMSGEALGTFIGRFKNFSYIDKEGTEKVIADLHFDKSAYKTPNGDLGNYLMDLAESDPDAFGMSIVFTDDGIYFKDPEGKVIPGIPTKETETDGKTYIKLKEFMGCDAVDQGAATDGLFSSTDMHPDKFAVQMTQFLDDHPQLLQFIQDHPEKIEPFLNVYNQYKMKNKSENKESKFAQLGKYVANLFKEGSPESFDIDGSTDDGTAIRVVTESESAAEGDQVLIVSDDDSTSPAPAGDHVITEGDLAGNTVTTDENGVITAIAETEAAEEETAEEEMAEEATETELAAGSLADLQKRIETLEAEKTSLTAQVQKLSKGRKVVAKKAADSAVVDASEKESGTLLTLSHGNEERATRLAEQKAKFPHLARLIDGEKAIKN